MRGDGTGGRRDGGAGLDADPDTFARRAAPGAGWDEADDDELATAFVGDDVLVEDGPADDAALDDEAFYAEDAHDDAYDDGELVDEEDALYDGDEDEAWYAEHGGGSLPPPSPDLRVPDGYDDDPDAYDDADVYEAEAYDLDDLDDLDDVEPVAARAVAPAAAARAAEPAIWAPGTAPGAWVPLGRPQFARPMRDPSGLTPTRTRRRNLSVFSLAGITNVLLLAYGVTAALLAAFTAALARRRGALTGLVDAAEEADALARSAHLVSVTTAGVVALLAVTILASMTWTGVAVHNHRMLGGPADASPTLAIVGWVIPLAHLVLPLRAVSEVAAGPDGRRSAPPSTVRWWIGWVLSMLGLGYVLWTTWTTSDADLPEVITRLTLASVAATVCFLYCFSQASVLFRHVARLQHDLAVERD